MARSLAVELARCCCCSRTCRRGAERQERRVTCGEDPRSGASVRDRFLLLRGELLLAGPTGAALPIGARLPAAVDRGEPDAVAAAVNDRDRKRCGEGKSVPIRLTFVGRGLRKKKKRPN